MASMIIFWKNCLLLFFLMSPVILVANDISEMILENGLKVIVKPDTRSPSVAFQIWYKVGSSYEYDGLTGVSHMLEHLMFSSSDNVFLSRSFHQMNKVGSKGGAYTGRDDTLYYHKLAKEFLPLSFDVESERMRHLSASNAEFDIEKKVIKEELHTSLAREPYLLAHQTLYKHAYANDSYQYPVIGRLNDLNNLKLSDAMLWHKNYYTPDNATIVVVGDVIPSEVFKLAKKYFSSITKSKKIFQKKSQKQFSQSKPIRYVMPEKNKVGAVLLAYKVPSIKTSIPQWEAYALEVLAGWLETGTHSRLTKALVRDKLLAYEITVSYSPMQRKNSLFIIEAIPAQGVSIQQLEKELLEEILKIKNEQVSQKSLQKIKNQMVATEVFDRDSTYIQAKIIGQAESVGIDWSEDAQYISRISAVTAEQLKQVLNKYFVPTKRTIIIQNPYDEKI
ncbi:MAG: insulinase family protein [Gammaproteobacteria bacterium]|nr:insulinase family protein [Gammaproteobacteria bacterium]